MWCPKCKIEYRKGITVCADCGTELVQRDGEYGVDICEISNEAAAEELIKFLSYSGIEGIEKEQNEESTGFKIMVPEKAAKKAEKLVHGYLIAKEEEKEEAEKIKEDTPGESFEQQSVSGGQESEEESLFSDEVEDTVELLHSSSKNEYVKMADKYRDVKFSGLTFIFFGIMGGLYLTLCKLEIIPIRYNIFVFCVIAVLFAGFFISGIVSIIKSQSLKGMIPEEEKKTREITAWLDENLTKDMIEKWSDKNVSDGENDLLIAAHIRTMLMGEYQTESEAYLEMIADEYYEEHYFHEIKQD